MVIWRSQAIFQKSQVPVEDTRLHILDILPYPPLVRLLLLPLEI